MSSRNLQQPRRRLRLSTLLVITHVLLAVLGLSRHVNCLRPSGSLGRRLVHRSQSLHKFRAISRNLEPGALEDKIQSMRVKEINDELIRLNVATADVFEKEELVRRLVKARKGISEDALSSDAFKNNPSPSPTRIDETAIVSPMYFTSVDSGRNIASIEIQAGDKPYVTMQIEVLGTRNSPFSLILLVDTACSCMLLRPSVVEKHSLTKLSTPVTMMGAGGMVGATGLTQIDRFSVPTQSSGCSGKRSRSFGPMPAAVQDIGGLPYAVDGIIGLSFLNHFACLDMDFTKGMLTFFERLGNNLVSELSLPVASRANMGYLPSWGLYTVDVFLDDKGPVKMLVDTGASATLLNWKGIADLGLSRDNNLLHRHSNPYGAMGSDNVAWS